MTEDAQTRFERLLQQVQQTCAQDWAALEAVVEPELRHFAEALTSTDAELRRGRLSEEEAHERFQGYLEQLRQRLLAAGVGTHCVEAIAQIAETLRWEMFPDATLFDLPVPPPAGHAPVGRPRAAPRPVPVEPETRVGAARGGWFRRLLRSKKPRVQVSYDVAAKPPLSGAAPPPAQALDRAWGEKAAVGAGGAGDLVDCSVFATACAAPGSEILLQAFAHLPEHEDEARRLAAEQDEAATRRGFTTLDTLIERGSTLSFEISLAQSTVEESMQHLRWQGRTAYVAFMAHVSEQATGNLRGKLIVSQDGLPIGRILFQVKVGQSTEAVAEPTGDAKRYHKAFISYASKDRTEVLKRVQMLRIHRIEFFQDVLTLDPGQRWEQELYKHIDDADLFLLFWSSSARASEWVRKELEYATARKHGVAEADPDIVPVIIEGPPPAPPPQGYDYLHFNDRLIYFMR